jgi:hypothetical protein
VTIINTTIVIVKRVMAAVLATFPLLGTSLPSNFTSFFYVRSDINSSPFSFFSSTVGFTRGFSFGSSASLKNRSEIGSVYSKIDRAIGSA